MRPAVRASPERQLRVPSRIGQHAWQSLPALALGSAAWTMAGALVVVIAPGISPVSILLAAVLFGPFASALTAAANDIALGEGAEMRGWLRAVRRFAMFGIRHQLTVAVPVALFVVALHVWQQTGASWVLASLGVSGAAGLLGVAGLPAVLILGTSGRPSRWAHLWGTGLTLVATHPVRMLAAPALAGFGVWVATAWSASLLLLVPAPVALVAVTAVWTCVEPPGSHSETDS